MKTKVLFLLPYPLFKAPSQRFRVEAFFPLLESHKIEFRTDEFLDEKAWKLLYQQGSTVQKGWAVIRGFLKRLFTVLFVAPQYDYVFIHREASPLGPPIFEWILAMMFRKKIIFDFDDAIWIPAVSKGNKIALYIKWFSKISTICKWAYKISAGNEYLANWSKQFNQHVVITPTSVDTVNRFNRLKQVNRNKMVIGWTGSHSTLKYLDVIYPVLQRLEEEFAFEFLVICNQPPSFQLKSMKFIPWQETSEIEDLLKIDIGVMPLLADAWSEGKCGFKIIQYLALGIPAVASPVGVNKDIVEDGRNGYLCSTEKEWYVALKRLLGDSLLRGEMGMKGREKIVKEYSVQANADNLLSFFK
ncbi:glycosyltransferase [Chitinophagaceae bacterium LB-8]|uniref:Glycosyltransferase n=1 Tax=Paraflavisolibacter caeni TaxID=2982496 RepID=A0A9X2XXP9_9BACT|nr:glycosyltransferase [Paraflavisolibacter caeni]MCU7551306.1 glycosyltransferase [Paraflavisolibacter caeni]